MENDASKLMNHTLVGLPFESFISNSAIMTNVELVDNVRHVLHKPRNTGLPIPTAIFNLVSRLTCVCELLPQDFALLVRQYIRLGCSLWTRSLSLSVCGHR